MHSERSASSLLYHLGKVSGNRFAYAFYSPGKLLGLRAPFSHPVSAQELQPERVHSPGLKRVSGVPQQLSSLAVTHESSALRLREVFEKSLLGQTVRLREFEVGKRLLRCLYRIKLHHYSRLAAEQAAVFSGYYTSPLCCHAPLEFNRTNLRKTSGLHWQQTSATICVAVNSFRFPTGSILQCRPQIHRWLCTQRRDLGSNTAAFTIPELGKNWSYHLERAFSSMAAEIVAINEALRFELSLANSGHIQRIISTCPMNGGVLSIRDNAIKLDQPSKSLKNRMHSFSG